MAKKTYYMHTLDGKPAVFTGKYVCTDHRRVKTSEMATSLRQIRHEHQQSFDNRRTPTYTDTRTYGYIRIVVDT